MRSNHARPDSDSARKSISQLRRLPDASRRHLDDTLRRGAFFICSLSIVLTIGCGGGHSGSPILGGSPTVETCNETGNILPGGSSDQPIDLQINGVHCVVDGSGSASGVAGSYVYRNVNIWNGGSLTFADQPVNPAIDFHAHSILVENGGTLQAGTTSGVNYPLTIWLWGTASDGIPSIACQSDSKMQCGVSDSDWNSNPSMAMQQMPTMACSPASSAMNLPNNDCFYKYEVLESGDAAGAYFGKKVLAVSAGGSLMLRGAKGIRLASIEANPADSSTSWGRLTKTLQGGETSFTIDRPVSTWASGDHITLTTTDYLPSHTEELVIASVTNQQSSATITVQSAVQFPHSGQTYDYTAAAAQAANTGPAPDTAVTNLPAHNIETRAIVALLSRNIVIASEGAKPTYTRGVDHFLISLGSPANYEGGHTLARQGFSNFQVQGVEFYQLGQGGLIGHYPVHFHMARSVPQPQGSFLGTFVADSSIVDSMTRFITVHATQGVTLARNVGYKSIGHGFYLEDATETNNRLYSNVGISVQGALSDPVTNPRMVPGILDSPQCVNPLSPSPCVQGQPFVDDPPLHADVLTPSAFWIMNTWNDFEYNAAVGVGSCGACYWMPPAGISGPSQYETWTGYAGLQKGPPFYGAAPMMNFKGNSCTAAMSAITTVGQTNQCLGISVGPGTSSVSQLYSVPNPKSVDVSQYPQQSFGQRAKTTVCDAAHQSDCSTMQPCTGAGSGEAFCLPFVLDHFTTSFNWAPTNFAAIWLRGWWFLLDNSAITDVQNAGLTFISGGGYTRSDAAQGFWSVLKNGVLVGNTQPNLSSGFPANPFASNAGPFNPATYKLGLQCSSSSAFCISLNDGITFVASNFGVNQRMFNIYDGPASQYNTIYSDVHKTVLGALSQCRDNTNMQGTCSNQQWLNGYQIGVLQSPSGNLPTNDCILPNAAIAWKQPNGFYYPPAFNSSNLVFNNVDIRHFVIQPAYLPGTLTEDLPQIMNTYCTWQPTMFGSAFTDIDRQTELTDNDGTLTGLTSNNTTATPQSGAAISVNKDPFFNAPVSTDECASGQPDPQTDSNTGATAFSSPYQYVTTALVAQCAVNNGPCTGVWTNQCSTPACYGVPLYRQLLTSAEQQANSRPLIHMMGQASAQRSTLTINHGNYYMDTTVSQAVQGQTASDLNVFQPSQVYNVFFLFANNATKQTYSFYLGTGLSQADAQAAIIPSRVQTPDNSFPYTEYPGSGWATLQSYDSGTGLATVAVDMTSASDLDPANRSSSCQPTTYCAWNSTSNTCGCKAGSGCTDDQVCSYATKDIDCPANGCYGFDIHMPSTFATGTQTNLPPTPTLFTADPFFQQGTVAFANATQSAAGACYYPTAPTGSSSRAFRFLENSSKKY
jgi:hypothetical protein